MRLIDADLLHKEISAWPESVMYKDWVQSAIANAPTIAPPTNGPLTPEELRELEEDWVWIELLVPLYRMESGYYRKRSRFSDADKFCCGYPNVVIRDLPYSLYGDTWLACRRRREEPRPEPAPPAWREHLLRRFERAE